MLQELWSAIRGGRPATPSPIGFIPDLPADDEYDSIVKDAEQPSGQLDQIAGFMCILSYVDGKGQASQRRVTCIRLEKAADRQYLRAFCHERGAKRQFRLDKITAVADVATAEILADDAASYFSRFAVGHVQSSRIGWGISVQERADLIAGLNVLAFMARCDEEWHPTERESIERFVTSYWLRGELEGDPPVDDIIAHAERMSPDPEVFFVSLTRCHERPKLAPVIRRAIQGVIEADGRIHEKEFYWGGAVDDYFRSLAP